MATIGQVAKATGISIETLRYYEKLGLIEAPHRKHNGYRDYTDATIARVHFILNAKRAGLTLKDIGELLALSSEASSQQVKTLIDTKLLAITEQLESLQRIQQTLTQLSNSCDGAKAISDCPIMDAFNAYG